jgi:Sulfotransferase family
LYDRRVRGVQSTITRFRQADARTSPLKYLLSTAGGTSGSRPKDIAIKAVRAYERDRWRFSPKRLGLRVDRIALVGPIFFIGTQGASETVIGRCLRRNRDVVSVSGNSRQWTGADEMGTIGNRMEKLPRNLWGSKHRADLPHPLIATDQPYACNALLPFYRRTASDATPADARRFARLLREHVSVYAHDPKRARFLDKTHAYTVKIPLLAELLAESPPFFVLVVRNPYAACRWAVARKRELFHPHVSNLERLEVLSEHWANAYATALEDAARVPNVVVVRFEDFLDATESVIRSLCDFVGLEFERAMLPLPGQKRPFATLPGDRKWYPLYQSDWLSEMTDEEEAIITRHCDRLARRFGYDPQGAAGMSAPIEILSLTSDRASTIGA